MDMELKDEFIDKWRYYFHSAELPVIFYYADEVRDAEPVEKPKGHMCIMGEMAKLRRVASLYFGAETIGCFGGKRYLGFGGELMPDFEYFLSCGIEGKLEGERYKKTPEIVREMMKKSSTTKAPAKYIVFKRWDMLAEYDEPEVVIFFGQAGDRAGYVRCIGTSFCTAGSSYFCSTDVQVHEDD